ncbi:hypothetical protein J1N35_019422 [Gossypium stocksii]|uniref:DUF4219 domain-containing protein n=1 Tax=Gossypium stocksii TaxID=47602 RepID=A0A9D3VSW7_9ROSI|nr:hypothetical protein J1N35_019422 [Gossypium stocksii]
MTKNIDTLFGGIDTRSFCFIELSIGIRAQTLETVLPPREKILKVFKIEATSQKISFMASEKNFTILGEGHSTMRPSLFNSTSYSYWRTRMKLFIQANDYEVWKIVTNGLSILIERVECAVIAKEESEWDKNEIKKTKPKEGIKDMSDHFTHIINGLKALRKTYPNKEMVKKILNCLPTSQEPKMATIEESKDLN